MTLPTILLWIEEHPVLFSVIGIAAPICFKNLREIPGLVFRSIQKWISKDRIAFQDQMRKEVKEANADRKEFRSEIALIRAMAERADKALFNGGRTGIVQQLQLLTAEANKEFEETPVPMFKCDIHGNNLITNSAYRRLIGATKEESLEGTRWMSVIYGELAVYYIETFKRCVESEEDFQCETDFRNPKTGEHRGRWRVIAPVLHVGNGAIWVGALEYALDDKANELADTLGLEVKHQ